MSPHPGKSHGQRSLVACSPWGREESDMTERLHFHFSLSCIGKGNGSPLQCSCLENPRIGGAWWAAVYGVAQSRTRLKRLSSRALTLEHLLFPLKSYGVATSSGYQTALARIGPSSRRAVPFMLQIAQWGTASLDTITVAS